MAKFANYIKGILMFLVITLMFYYYWDNIFSNLIEFVGTDWLDAVDGDRSTSLAILKSVAWISFVVLYLAVGPILLIVNIISDKDTKPLETFKGIGIWALTMPIFSIFYGVMYLIIDTLNDVMINNPELMDEATRTTADTFSWIFGLLGLAILTAVPFYFVLKGYGLDLGFGGGERNEIQTK